MFTAVVQGNVTCTMRHATLRDARLLIVQPVDPATGKPQGFAQIAVDVMGAGVGQRVILSNDGRAVQDALKVGKDCPARLAVTALLDPPVGE